MIPQPEIPKLPIVVSCCAGETLYLSEPCGKRSLNLTFDIKFWV